MKIIAHRGASLLRPENSIEALSYASELGADLAECDVTRLSDGSYVMYHDNNLKRLTGIDRQLSELTIGEFRSALEEHGCPAVTFGELLERYKCHTPILLHIKMPEPQEDFLSMIRGAALPFVFGVITEQAAERISRYFPAERILAFIPKAGDAEGFYNKGCGIIRLWENWLDSITPEDIKQKFPGTEVWVMSRGENKSANGSIESLNRLLALGTDGVLLNDIELALKWRASVSR